MFSHRALTIILPSFGLCVRRFAQKRVRCWRTQRCMSVLVFTVNAVRAVVRDMSWNICLSVHNNTTHTTAALEKGAGAS